jgi:hypothetical protein
MKRLTKSRKNAAAMPTTETLERRSENASRAWVSACVLVGLLTGKAEAVNIEMVPVGNPGNAADTRYDATGFGSVGYNYQIGKYEVTVGQYIEFLNAVAKADPNGGTTRTWAGLTSRARTFSGPVLLPTSITAWAVFLAPRTLIGPTGR